MSEHNDPDSLATVSEATRKLGISRATLYRRLKRGELRDHYSSDGRRLVELKPTGGSAPERCETNRLLPLRDAILRLGIGRTTAYRLISEGKLRTVKIGNLRQVALSEVERLIAEGT